MRSEKEILRAFRTLRTLSKYGITGIAFLLESWFGGSITDKAVEMTVAYLNDPDAPDGKQKVWCYFNR